MGARSIRLCVPLFCILCACTRSPEIPHLIQREPHPIQKILLDDRIGQKDIRALFDALNTEGQLNPLERFFKHPSDLELEKIAQFFSTYIFEDALSKKGLVEILSERINTRSFSKLLAASQPLHQHKLYPATADLILYNATHPLFIKLLRKQLGFLNPQWRNLLEQIRDLSASSTEIWTTPKPSSNAVLTDLNTFLQRDGTEKMLLELKTLWHKHSVGSIVISALRQSKMAFPSNPRSLFDGFEIGSRRLFLTQPLEGRDDGVHHNQLDGLLHLADIMNQPSNGLFRTAQRKIQDEPGLIRSVSEPAQILITEAITGFLLERLKIPHFDKAFWLSLTPEDPTNTQFTQLFREILKAITEITGSPKPSDLHANMPIYLNALVMTNWLSTQIRNQREFLTSLSPQTLIDELWTHPFSTLSFRAEILKKEGEFVLFVDGHKFPISLENQVKLIGGDLENFWSKLKQEFSGRLLYTLGSPSEKSTLERALHGAIADTDATLSYANGKSFVTSLGYFFARPRKNLLPIHLEDFESENMIDDLHRALWSLTPERYSNLEKIIFVDLGLRDLSLSDENFYLQFFGENAPLQEVVRKILNWANTLYEFNQSKAEGLPPPFALYSKFVSQSNRHNMPWLGQLLSFFYKARLFSSVQEFPDKGDGGWLAEYPGLHGYFTGSNVLSRILYILSSIEESEIDHFLFPFRSSTEETGLENLLCILRAMIKERPGGMLALIKLLQDSDLGNAGLVKISHTEFSWIQNLVQDDIFVDLFGIALKYLDRSAALEAVHTLQQMVNDKTLSRTFSLLGYIQNDRMKQISSLGLKWLDSGELSAFLSSLENLLHPVNEPWQSPEFVPVKKYEGRLGDSSLSKDPVEKLGLPIKPPQGQDQRTLETTLIRNVLGTDLQEVGTQATFAYPDSLATTEYRAEIDPEIGGNDLLTVSCLKERWTNFWDFRARKLSDHWDGYNRTPFCLYWRIFFNEPVPTDPSVAPSMPHPCVTKVFKYREAIDHNWVFADSSCFIQETSLGDLKNVLEDMEHYVQVPQAFERDAQRDPTGMPIIEDGFRYIEKFQPLNENYLPVNAQKPPNYPALIYGRIRMKLLAFDLRSHYLIDVWPAQSPLNPNIHLTSQSPDPPLDFSKEYLLRWSGHAKPVDEIAGLKRPKGLSALDHITLKSISKQYGSWYLKRVMGGTYLRYHLAEELPKHLTGAAPTAIRRQEGNTNGLALKESTYSRLARLAHQDLLMGLIQRVQKEKFLIEPGK